MSFKYDTETTVKEFLKINTSQIQKDLEYEKKTKELLKKDYGDEKIEIYENFLKYHTEVVTIIKQNKLKPNSKISISFSPVFNKIKADSKDLSKLGGIPYSFLKENIKPLLKNKDKFFNHLKNEYPKDNNGRYLTFVGDIDSSAPSFFINEVMPKLGPKGRDQSNPIFRKDGYSTASTSLGSLFIDQNLVMMGSQQSSGTWMSKKYLNLYKYSEKELELYLQYMTEFLKKEVKTEYMNIDKFELTVVESWIPKVELLTDEDSFFFETLSTQPHEREVLKLFGYPESQQSIYPYFCTNGYFGPRLLTPFVSIFNNDVDMTIQVYADLISVNGLNEDYGYLKVDLSCT